ncbi:MAG: hypothetical protein HYT83_03660 [Candidatus Levybacteria bacterium]|nr:hypothetical protein [Candidatus Levybacteria bacterium]
MTIKNPEKRLAKMRKFYQRIEPSSRLAKSGWTELKTMLEPQEEKTQSFWHYQRFLLVTIIVLCFLGLSFGVVQASQKSLPGDLLYSVKQLSENLTVAVSGNIQTKLKNRAEEIINAIENKKDPQILKETVKNYREEVSKTKREVKKSGKQKEFNQQLQENEQQFKQVEKNSSSGKNVREAIEASRKGRNGGGDSKEKESEEQKQEEIKPAENKVDETNKDSNKGSGGGSDNGSSGSNDSEQSSNEGKSN